ncbi:MAG: hypothetical protein N4A31_07075 [Rickettsiales bacterium]|jgi:hypothetical protein|nr:hypothetical protein [Rickettsiales bacterium]
MKEKGGDNAKDDEKEEPGERPSSSVVSDYLPSMISFVPLVITLRYLPISSNSASVASSSSDPYPTEEEGTDYLYYATMFPVLMLSAFCMVTFLCNAIFGRRPDFDGRHNPVSHQIAENIGDAVAPTLAVFSTIIRLTSTTILGQRATAINRFVNRGFVAADVAARAVTTADELYDHAMDRCPMPNTGNMRRIEYVAMLTENFIVGTIEFLTHGIFAAMNMGMTRISLTPQNRLYVLAGIYRTADLAETFFVTYTDDLAWFLEHIVDTPPIARILRSTGIADPEHPIHGVAPRNIPERIQDGIEGIGKTIKDAAHNVEGGFEHFGKNVQKFFTGNDENKKEVDNQDDGGGKMSPEELDEYNQQQAQQNEDQQEIPEHWVSQLFSEFPAIYGGLSEEDDNNLSIGEMIIDALGPDTRDIGTNTERGNILAYQNLNGSTNIEGGSFDINFHTTSRDEASSKHRGLNGLVRGQHPSHLTTIDGIKIHSYINSEGHLVIVLGEISAEVTSHSS